MTFLRADLERCEDPSHGGMETRPAYRCTNCRETFCNSCTDMSGWDGVHCARCGSSKDGRTLRLRTGHPGLIHIGAALEHHTHWLEMVGTHYAEFGGELMAVHPLTISLPEKAKETLDRNAGTPVWTLTAYNGSEATLTATAYGPRRPGVPETDKTQRPRRRREKTHS